jgi:hypothetical protein
MPPPLVVVSDLVVQIFVVLAVFEVSDHTADLARLVFS